MSDPPLEAQRHGENQELLCFGSYLEENGAEMRRCTENALRGYVKRLPRWVVVELATELDPHPGRDKSGWLTRAAQALYERVCENLRRSPAVQGQKRPRDGDREPVGWRPYYLRSMRNCLADLTAAYGTRSRVAPRKPGDVRAESNIITMRIKVFSENGVRGPKDKKLVTTAVDTPVAIDVLAWEAGVADRPNSVTVTIHTNPSHGAAELDRETGIVTYTPALGFIGIDSFQYGVRAQACRPKTHLGDWRRHLSEPQELSELSELLSDLRSSLNEPEFQVVNLLVGGCKREEIAPMLTSTPRREKSAEALGRWRLRRYDAILTSAKAILRNRFPWLRPRIRR